MGCGVEEVCEVILFPMASFAKDVSPLLERFITEHLVGRDDEFRTVKRPQNHEALLVSALRRRKIKVQNVDSKHRNFIYSGDVIGGMDRMVTTLVSDLARRLCTDKWRSKQLFELRGLPVPAGREFGVEEFDAAVAHLGSMEGPAVLKPVAARSGNGITLGIRSAAQLEKAWDHAGQARLSAAQYSQTLLLEEFCEGLDVRVFVVGEQAVSVLVRVPPYLRGDGRSTVGELLEASARLRSRHRHLTSHGPQLSAGELDALGLSLESVPQEGRLLLLREQANIRDGGLPVDVTEETADAVKELAVEALWAVPGLNAGAVDLLVPALGGPEGAVVLEANAGANIMPHRYPAYGRPRAVAEKIAEQVLLKKT